MDFSLDLGLPGQLLPYFSISRFLSQFLASNRFLSPPWTHLLPLYQRSANHSFSNQNVFQCFHWDPTIFHSDDISSHLNIFKNSYLVRTTTRYNLRVYFPIKPNSPKSSDISERYHFHFFFISAFNFLLN